MNAADDDVLDLAALRRRVQAVIDDEIAVRTSQLAAVGREADLLVDAIAELLRGGKRLRAAFCYWGYRAIGGVDNDAIVAVATSMEFFQAAALIHDDVMDDSDVRRGLPAAHRRLAQVHREAGWTGLPERFGTAGAILAGNLCLTWTDSLFAGAALSRTEAAAARPIFDQMRTQLMGGQFLDVVEAARGWDRLDLAGRLASSRHVIAYKSAKYSVEHPLLIGAAAAGADQGGLAVLADFGLAVGEAFQLRDDLLGVFGDPEQTGKPAGDDLAEGKRTVLVAYTLQALGGPDHDRFLAQLGRSDLSADDITWMRGAIRASGAVDAVEADITRLRGEAADRLAQVAGIDAAGRQALTALADLATARTS